MVICAILFWINGVAHGQFVDANETPHLTLKSTQHIDDSKRSRSALIDALEKTDRTLHNLEQRQQDLGGIPQRTSLPSSSSSPPDFLEPYRSPELNSIKTRMPSDETAEHSSDDWQLRTESVRKRLEMLNLTIQQERKGHSETPESNDSASLDSPTIDAESTDSRTAAQNFPGVTENLEPPVVNEPQPESLPTGTAILANPVDLFEVANSLFMTGNAAKALEYYNTIENDKRDEFDQLWFDYMQASAHRQSGDLERATKKYRDVVARKASGVNQELSQFWLQHIEQLKTSKSGFEEIEAQLNLIAQELQK